MCFPCKPGFIGPNLPHCWSGLCPSSGVAVQFDPDPQQGLLSLPGFDPLESLWDLARRGLLFKGRFASELGHRMREMIDEDTLPRTAELLLLLHYMLGQAKEDSHLLCEKPFVLSKASRHADTISTAIDIIVQHYHEEITLEDTCESVGMHRATFCRYFRAYTGQSFVEFLNSVRIDEARRQLVNSADSVSAIAFRVGFSNGG